MEQGLVCKISVSEDLSQYMDCMLDGRSMRRISRHLKGCSECREVLSDLMRIRASMREVRKAPGVPSQDFWADTFRAARLVGETDSFVSNTQFHVQPKQQTSFSVRRAATYAAAAALVIGAIVSPFSLSGKSPSVQPVEAAETVDVEAIVSSHAHSIIREPLVSRPRAVMIESESTARQTGNTVDEAVFDIDQSNSDSPPAIH